MADKTYLVFKYEARREAQPETPGQAEFAEQQWLTLRTDLEARNWKLTEKVLAMTAPAGFEVATGSLKAQHIESPVPVNELALPAIQDFLQAMRAQDWAILSGGEGVSIMIFRNV